MVRYPFDALFKLGKENYSQSFDGIVNRQKEFGGDIQLKIIPRVGWKEDPYHKQHAEIVLTPDQIGRIDEQNIDNYHVTCHIVPPGGSTYPSSSEFLDYFISNLDDSNTKDHSYTLRLSDKNSPKYLHLELNREQLYSIRAQVKNQIDGK